MALVVSLFSATAHAQQPAVVTADPLQRLVVDQERRLKTLEMQVAALQATILELRRQAGLAPSPDVPANAPQAADEAPAVAHAVSGVNAAQVDPHAPEADLPAARPIEAYGSLRLATAVNTDGVSDIRNNSSRMGLRGEKALGAGLTAFARLELGVNLVANDRTILETGDPGAPIGQGSQAFSSRLGFIGLATRVGSVSWGKQWSPYYDVAEFTDQFQLFSGAASGAFAAGTDGGLAGTGRAERAVQYRKRVGLVSIGVQVQNRATSPNDQPWLDTWGGAVVVGGRDGFAAAATYNQVRDGVEHPNPNQSQLGDEAALFGVRYRSASWYGAATFSILRQHEVDDRGQALRRPRSRARPHPRHRRPGVARGRVQQPAAGFESPGPVPRAVRRLERGVPVRRREPRLRRREGRRGPRLRRHAPPASRLCRGPALQLLSGG